MCLVSRVFVAVVSDIGQFLGEGREKEGQQGFDHYPATLFVLPPPSPHKRNFVAGKASPGMRGTCMLKWGSGHTSGGLRYLARLLTDRASFFTFLRLCPTHDERDT